MRVLYSKALIRRQNNPEGSFVPASIPRSSAKVLPYSFNRVLTVDLGPDIFILSRK